MSGYTTREVARLLGLSPSRVRRFVDAGFLQPSRGPRGAFRYSFQDLVILRTAQGLVASRIPKRRVMQALARLKSQLPRGRSLAEVRIRAQGDRLLVEDNAATWEPESGQQMLRLDVAELAERAAPLASAKLQQAALGSEQRAEDWFDLGYELEPTAIEESVEAYRRAVELDPRLVEARLNLGRLLHELGQLREAESHYRSALEQRPRDSTAAFNLGVVLQDQGRLEESIEAYSRAVDADASFADAYFNLADVYEQLGQKAAAIRNLKLYRRLRPE